MGIMKKRNAVLGWAVWKIGKRIVKRKAKAVVPGTGGGGAGRSSKPAVVAGLAALGGALLFWRRKSGGNEPTQE
jgi:hypothetical protein